MNRFPDFQTDLLFSDNPPSPAGDAETEVPAKTADTHAEPAGAAHEATTTQPAPLAPQMQGVLEEPISGGQTFLLAMFGVLAFCMLVAMTRFGSKNNYGD